MAPMITYDSEVMDGISRGGIVPVYLVGSVPAFFQLFVFRVASSYPRGTFRTEVRV